jgi:hypothetical protein
MLRVDPPARVAPLVGVDAHITVGLAHACALHLARDLVRAVGCGAGLVHLVSATASTCSAIVHEAQRVDGAARTREVARRGGLARCRVLIRRAAHNLAVPTRGETARIQ